MPMTADEMVAYLKRVCEPMLIPEDAMARAVKKLSEEIESEMFRAAVDNL